MTVNGNTEVNQPR